jgi:hypothetical protein
MHILGLVLCLKVIAVHGGSGKTETSYVFGDAGS